MPARYAIGIDLGTTHCALAYVDLRSPAGAVRVLPIRQLESLDTVAEHALLPSFFYFPAPAETDGRSLDPFSDRAGGESAGFVIGTLARERMNTCPERVIHSAKSWLAHGGVDREAQILPFSSEEVPPQLRLSPVEASAAFLDHLKIAWDHAFAHQDLEDAFVRQRIVLTVPASFDEAAQALTRAAAELAGYPPEIRLLEEPQAAFYAWLDGGPEDRPGDRLLEFLPELAHEARNVLVIDIGGGTSDFSLFRIAPIGRAESRPRIERIAAGDHLLLGGDNIDLALAHRLERRLMGESDERLSRRQWSHLLPQARRLKERILASEGNPEDDFHVSVPGDSGSLFASAMSVTVTRRLVEQVVLDGFFPPARGDESPRGRQSGLLEFGLPYAADSAISRHLAAFLRGRGEVHAVLFAGGSLIPGLLRERLLDLIGSWQGWRPAQLASTDMSLAIARGAARFAALVATEGARIRAGQARSIYLELHRDATHGPADLVCVLPQGFEEGGRLRLDEPAFLLRVNQPVRFSAYASTRRPFDRPGAIVPLAPAEFHALPPLYATVTMEGAAFNPRKAASDSIRVRLEAELTELGVLRLFLVDVATGKPWRLDFNLRQPLSEPAGAGESSTGESSRFAPEKLAAAERRIALFYGPKQALAAKDNAKSLIRDLERTLAAERGAWNAALLRAMWPALVPGITRRGRSLDHEKTWLYLAGFLLRPGYGSELDAWRMTQLWECFDLGLIHRKEKSAWANWWMMWRRTAGGLSAAQQQLVFDQAWRELRRSPLGSVEGVRLLATLERAPLAARTGLAEHLCGLVLSGKAANQPHVFWALGRLLGRVPLYTAADSVLPAATVEAFFDRVEALDWSRGGLQPLVGVFSAAARMTGVRALDIHDPIRARVLDKLKRSGAKEELLCVVREHHHLSPADRNNLLGEELPAGLSLAQD